MKTFIVYDLDSKRPVAVGEQVNAEAARYCASVATGIFHVDLISDALSFGRLFVPLVTAIACVFISSVLAQSAQPNIVIILADDLGYGDVGFNGCPDYVTPNIDSLAANGVWCSSGYVTHPFCSPSRAGLITGRYQQRFGL